MTEPLSLDVILSEFSEDTQAWVLQEESSRQYLIIPHRSYPGRRPIHLFLSREDAERMLLEILDENEGLRNRNVFPTQVKLLETLRSIAAGRIPEADSFAVHSPNEVYEYVRDRST